MYILKTEAAFDSAHFLGGYCGKCSNIHGHRWRIVAEISGEKLCCDKQENGMLIDFGKFKSDLKQIADDFDHALIYEENSLKPSTVSALNEEGFRLVVIPCRPTAENLARIISEKLSEKGYKVHKIAVYETPENCAVFCP